MYYVTENKKRTPIFKTNLSVKKINQPFKCSDIFKVFILFSVSYLNVYKLAALIGDVYN